MKSTPVSAMARTVPSVTPPLASVRAAGDQLDGLANERWGHVVEQDDVGAGGTALDLRQCRLQLQP
jgi:hypothetical protein